jgi:hypothetical protein
MGTSFLCLGFAFSYFIVIQPKPNFRLGNGIQDGLVSGFGGVKAD